MSDEELLAALVRLIEKKRITLDFDRTRSNNLALQIWGDEGHLLAEVRQNVYPKLPGDYH